MNSIHLETQNPVKNVQDCNLLKCKIGLLLLRSTHQELLNHQFRKSPPKNTKNKAFFVQLPVSKLIFAKENHKND